MQADRERSADVPPADLEFGLPYSFRLLRRLQEMDTGYAAGVVRPLLLSELDDRQCLDLGKLLVTPSYRCFSCLRGAAVLGLVETLGIGLAATGEMHDPVPSSVLVLEVGKGVHGEIVQPLRIPALDWVRSASV